MSTADQSGTSERACLAALASYAWQLSRLSRRSIEKLPLDVGPRFLNQLRYLDRQIEDELGRLGIRTVDLQGQVFEAGAAATAVNAEDVSPDKIVRIQQTLEPVVVGPDGLMRLGVVLLCEDT